MRYLLLNQFFAPDLAPTGHLLGDVVQEIASQGHDAAVVCARATYAGAAGGSEARSPERVRVLRTPCLPFGRGRGARLLSYASFYVGALWQSLWATDCDAVVTMTTPPMLSLIGTLLKKLRGVRHYIWEMDLYPDVAGVGRSCPPFPARSRLGAPCDLQPAQRRCRHRSRAVHAGPGRGRRRPGRQSPHR